MTPKPLDTPPSPLTPQPEPLPVPDPIPVPEPKPVPAADVPIFKAVSEWRCDAEGRSVFLRLEDSTQGDKTIHRYVMLTDDKPVATFDAELFEEAKGRAIELLLALVEVDHMRDKASAAFERVMGQYEYGPLKRTVHFGEAAA